MARQTQFLSHTRQLTFEAVTSGEGYFPSGKAMIFQSEREPNNRSESSARFGNRRHPQNLARLSRTYAFFRPGTDGLFDPHTKTSLTRQSEGGIRAAASANVATRGTTTGDGHLSAGATAAG